MLSIKAMGVSQSPGNYRSQFSEVSSVWDAECPFVSVIIPVFNDAERLGRCLAALEQQSYPSDRYEIVVIDNGSDRPEAIEAVVQPYTRVTLAFEPTPGSYSARNKGISLAKGTAIAFTDADCLPAVDWLAKGIARLRETPNCGQVVGRVELCFANPQEPTIAELYDSLTALRQEQLLQELHGGATANVFTWRETIERVGTFDTRLKSAGDMEWGSRIFAAGYEQVYAADVAIEHPARHSFQAIYKRALRVAGGSYDWLVLPKQSFLQRQKMFARLVFDKLVQPVRFAIAAFAGLEVKGRKIDRLDDKLQLVLMSFLLRYGGILELFRRKFGGVARRE